MDLRNAISTIAVLGALFNEDKFARSAATFVSIDAKSYLLIEEAGAIVGHAEDVNTMRCNHIMPRRAGKETSRRSIVLYFGITAGRTLLVTIALIKDKKVKAFKKHQVT